MTSLYKEVGLLAIGDVRYVLYTRSYRAVVLEYYEDNVINMKFISYCISV